MDTCMPASTPLEQWNYCLQHWDRGTSFCLFAPIHWWSPCSCPPFTSSIHIYLSIYLPARTPQGRGFNISVPSGYWWKRRQPRDAGKKGRHDQYPEVRWTIIVRLTDPSPTICHIPTAHMDTHVRVRDKTRDGSFTAGSLNISQHQWGGKKNDQSLLNTKQTLGRICVYERSYNPPSPALKRQQYFL